MTDLPKGYVVYEGKRYKVVGAWRNDMGIGDVLMYRLDPGMGSWPNIAAPAVECQPWQRGTMRHIKGKAIHREKRPVHLDIDTGAEIIKARLKGKRTGYTCTFGGLYDLLARQQVINAKRDRAFAKRTGKKIRKV
jgi:hypothetical protein